MATIDYSTLVFFGDSLTDPGNLPEPQRPDPPYVDGRYTNGPVYAEIVPGEIGVTSLNYAYGGAQAVTDPGDDPFQTSINLTAQVDAYLAAQDPNANTAVSVFIGNNDYFNASPSTPGEAFDLVEDVLTSIDANVLRLVNAGAEHVLLYTLPEISPTPLGQDLTPAESFALDSLIQNHNEGVRDIAFGYFRQGLDVKVVDVEQLNQEIVTDPTTFGLQVIEVPLYIPDGQGGLVETGVTELVPAEDVAYFDPVHPTSEGHEILAAFSEATIRADLVEFAGDFADNVSGARLSDLLFGGDGGDRVSGLRGADTLFGGLGDDNVAGGADDDFLVAGSGRDLAVGGAGTDFLAGGAGNDFLNGGIGNDVIVDGSGSDSGNGAGGDDLFIFGADRVVGDVDVVNGAAGRDTLRLEVTADIFASAEFQDDYLAFTTTGLVTGRAYQFDSIDLTVSRVERIEVFVDGVEQAFAGAAAPDLGAVVAAHLRDADLWGVA